VGPRRNSLCPCGSGKRYKRCHGAIENPHEPHALRNHAVLEREALAALEHQRKRQQGLGRPIISVESKGLRYVAVGKRLFYGKWLTFSDFLVHYLKEVMGFSWGQAELTKSDSARHPTIQWMSVLADQMITHSSGNIGICTMPETGASRAVFSLAYDIYLAEHNAKSEVDEASIRRLLDRLRQESQFYGARHELRAAGILLRAGLDISWEDESVGRKGGHGEFIATFPSTGRQFWVECKMRQPENNATQPRFGKLLSAALRKETSLERIIFIDLNLHRERLNGQGGGWAPWADNQLRDLEKQPSATTLPSAIVILSNFTEHKELEDSAELGFVMEGFKTEHCRLGHIIDLWQAIENRFANPEIENIWKSIQEHSRIPDSFDGSLLRVDETSRLVIGRRYVLENNTTGILEEAVVMEQWQKAVCIFCTADGRHIYECELTDSEWEAWRQHPETFFGVVRKQGGVVKDGLDAFNFFYECYEGLTREQLLEHVRSHPDFSHLETLSQADLAKQAAYRMALSASGQTESPPVPEWHNRLRPA